MGILFTVMKLDSVEWQNNETCCFCRLSCDATDNVVIFVHLFKGMIAWWCRN